MKYLLQIKLCQYREKSKHLKHGVKKQFMKKDKDVWKSSDKSIPQKLQRCILKLTSQ